ncbi:MAG: hypothetical protein ACEPOW_06850 [Bacteroidales bacterium]
MTFFYYAPTNFDKSKWVQNVEERYKMSENLIDSKMLEGKTKMEVVELLGEDFLGGNQRMAYYLGNPPKPISTKIELLEINMKNGRVKKVFKITE